MANKSSRRVKEIKTSFRKKKQHVKKKKPKWSDLLYYWRNSTCFRNEHVIKSTYQSNQQSFFLKTNVRKNQHAQKANKAFYNKNCKKKRNQISNKSTCEKKNNNFFETENFKKTICQKKNCQRNQHASDVNMLFESASTRFLNQHQHAF